MSGLVMTSPDGITWTVKNVDPSANWSSIAWSPELGLFAVVATGGDVMTGRLNVFWTAFKGQYEA